MKVDNILVKRDIEGLRGQDRYARNSADFSEREQRHIRGESHAPGENHPNFLQVGPFPFFQALTKLLRALTL